ncbi:membrane insertase [Perilla frutescens var. hirtella]|nr:membrane insertase [Perilla frutescens var. frutescens]KAH6784297.1 membrane insertase [Perilla frutescens var. hirtella]
MSSTPPHPPQPSFRAPPPAAASLYKQNSWSPDSHRDEAWLRQKGRRNRRSRSVTDEDLDELKACIELGFDFDSPEMDQRLSDTFPAYGLYYAVNKQYNDAVSRTPPPCSPSQSDGGGGASSPHHSPDDIFAPGNNPQTVKTRLRQWAQVVACTVRQAPS